jgi:hypothetical protein
MRIRCAGGYVTKRTRSGLLRRRDEGLGLMARSLVAESMPIAQQLLVQLLLASGEALVQTP